MTQNAHNIVAFFVFVSLLISSSLFAGGTPATSTVADELITVTGSQSDTQDGDWISAFTDPNGDGLDTYHSFYVEVPDGASRLVIDLFDMDLLYEIDDTYTTGVTPAEQLAERDRIRAYTVYLDDTIANASNRFSYTFATYSLFDPSGAQVTTRRVHGSHFAPSDGDNAWVTFYDSSTAFDSGTFDTWADDFSGGTYAENDGTQNFTTDWIESQETGVSSSPGPGAGLIRITGGRLQVRDLNDFSPDTGREPGVERELDLSGYVAARLTFDYIVSNSIEDDDALAVEISADGGATWTVIDDFSGEERTYSGTVSYDISEFISSQTRVRFRVENLFAGSGEEVNFDNLEIRAQAAAPAAPASGHWEVRVDVSTNAIRDGITSINGDETNAIGIRAHDGDATASGTEMNVYTYTFTAGINPNDDGRDYTLFPYVTRGCTFDVNDFDWDSDLPNNPGGPNAPFGSLEIESPDGTFTSDSTGNLSENNVWATTTATAFTDNDTASQYGLWTMPFRVEDPNDGNYAPIYLADFDDAGTPLLEPLPDPDTFRIYLPSDGDGVPAKPYLQQFLTSAIVGQPNPPDVGETTRYAVTVRLVNPAGSIGDIDFDGVTRVVTARLPGGMASYEGVAILDQGTIVSEPAIGSTTPADIVWNPGTLAPDTVARLIYFLDVTGAAAPYTIDVTETPGSGQGTRATWIDETGAADFTFGELCQLRIESPAPPTPVVVSRFDAALADGEVMVEWETASEAGTLGFDLVRVDPTSADREAVLVAEARTPTLLPQGGTYRLVDPDAPTDRPLEYWLVERASQRDWTWGPFVVDPREDDAEKGGSRAMSSDAGFAEPHVPSDRFLARRERAARSAPDAGTPGAVKASGAVDRVKIHVDTSPLGGSQKGALVHVDAASLAEAFGVDEATVDLLVRSRRLALSVGGDGGEGGEDVAWMPAPSRDGFLFYAPRLDTPFTGTEVYWLERDRRGVTMRRAFGRPPLPDWDAESFRDTIEIEENLRPIVMLPLDPESDLWFWDFLRLSDRPVVSFALPVADPAPSPGAAGPESARLAIRLQGAEPGDHVFEVRLDGTYLGLAEVTDADAATVSLDVDPALLAETSTVELTAIDGDLAFVDGFTLEYERAARAVDDRLTLRPGFGSTTGSGGAATVAGLRRDDAVVLEVSDPLRPSLLRRRILPEADGYRVVWNPRDESAVYHVTTTAGFVAPAAMVPDTTHFGALDDLRGVPGSAIDYLVVAAPSLVEAAGDLATYRQGRGLASAVVSLEDVHDEFAAGRDDPRALRDFLAHVATAWPAEGIPAPRFVVLVGHGTYDYRDHWGFGDNLLPPLMRPLDGSLYPTDAAFADPGGDGTADFALGRLPVLDAAELSAVLAKIAAYEAAGDTDWDHRVTLLADQADAGGDFPADIDALRPLLPRGSETTVLRLDQETDTPTARARLFDLLAAGTAWAHWSGHGAVDRLAHEQLLVSGDVATLPNADRPTLLSAVSCTVGIHAVPGIDALAEELVLVPERGAVAVIAPAWLSENERARRFGDRLFREIFPSDASNRLGEAFRRALESTRALGSPAEWLDAYQLLGDPALEIQWRPEAVVPCSENCGDGG